MKTPLLFVSPLALLPMFISTGVAPSEASTPVTPVVIGASAVHPPQGLANSDAPHDPYEREDCELADWNGDGDVDEFDIEYFMRDYYDGNPACDMDGDGMLLDNDWMIYERLWREFLGKKCSEIL